MIFNYFTPICKINIIYFIAQKAFLFDASILEASLVFDSVLIKYVREKEAIYLKEILMRTRDHSL